MSNREKSSDKLATRTWPALPVPSAPFPGVWAAAALIAIATFIAYLPSINGGFVWDDDLLLTNNDLIKAPGGLDSIWCSTDAKDYWPGTNTSFWIEWRLWEMNPAGYHVTNLILHVAECLLIWIILRELSIPGAFLAAAVFALHPVNVESVAWISQRKNTMAMLFFLLSILWYVKGLQHAAGKVAHGRLEGADRETASSIIHLSSFIPHPSFYWLSLAAFVIAMLSKGSVAVLPLLLLGIAWWLRPLTRWDFVLSVPFFVVAAVLSGVNVWFQTHGTGEVIRTASFAERLVGAGGAIWFYIYKAFFPLELSPIYRQWRINALSVWWWLPLAAAFAVTALLWKYRKGAARPLVFAWGFFCVALAPALGFTDVLFMRYSLVADRYQHIAIIGIIALAAAGFAAFYERAGGGRKRGAAIALAIAALAALGLLTWRQNGCYSDEIALYKATLAKNPDSVVVRYDLGFALVQKGRPEEMIEQFEKALQLDPDFPAAHNGLGAILARMGRAEEAIKHFRKALEANPYYIEARINLGAALVRTGRIDEAIEQYGEVLRLRPGDSRALYNLGNAFSQANRLSEAIDCFQQAIKLKPHFPNAQNNLGIALARAGRIPEAISSFQQVLSLQPDHAEAHFNLGNLLFISGQLQEAIKHYESAVQIDPDYPEAHRNCGDALIQAGRPDQAIEHYRESLRLMPDVPAVYGNLAIAYAQTRQSIQAIDAAQRAIELARAQGQAAQAKKIEDWLNSYRAGLSK